MHYRHYLGRDDRPTVICVQDFNYLDYDPSRFLDKRAFASEEEAQVTPIDIGDTLEAMVEAPDRETAAQILRNICALQKSGMLR